ncbi:MAG TPA: chitobiase/beta-hexosaminidase C-terminal domain-containing protein, partial [Acidobacteriota bacterium]|nr:chitobiase/beta-hexosaminidase C-terminal domain-containing protein [Acidobacteriota bacterium]
GGADGSIKASVRDGVAPYSYLWSNGATTPVVTGLSRGVYSVTVTDAAGVQRTKAVYLADGAVMGQPVRVLPADEVAAPVFSLPSGRFTEPQSITLSTATPDATIRYTLDGATPTEASEPFVGELLVSNSATVKAAAFKAGFKTSRVSDATYVIDNGPANVKFTNVTATASAFGSGNTPAKALDGDLSTVWSSNGDGQWIQFDLGLPRRLAAFALTFNSAETRYYTFDVLVSLDGAAWTTILLGHQNPQAAGLQLYDIPDVDPVRYVRIVCHGSTYSATSNNVAEAEFYGGDTNSAIAPMIFTPPQSQVANAGATVTLSVDAFANPAPTYQWYVDGVLIPGATSATYTLNNVQVEDAGDYTVVVSNSSGSVTSAVAHLGVLPPPLGLLLQAENAVMAGAVVRSNQTGYTGTGFVDYINNSNDYIEWTANIPVAGTRALTFRYASTGAARVLALTVDGAVADGAVSFASTGGSNIWQSKTIYVSLPAGTVKLRLTATGTSGPNIDYLQID